MAIAKQLPRVKNAAVAKPAVSPNYFLLGSAEDGYEGVTSSYATGEQFAGYIVSQTDAPTGGPRWTAGLFHWETSTGGNELMRDQVFSSSVNGFDTDESCYFFIAPLPGNDQPAIVGKATGVSVATGAGSTISSWASLHDPYGLWSATGAKFNLPDWCGALQVCARVSLVSGAGTMTAGLLLVKYDAALTDADGTSWSVTGGNGYLSTPWKDRGADKDYLEISIAHNGSAAVPMNIEFSVNMLVGDES